MIKLSSSTYQSDFEIDIYIPNLCYLILNCISKFSAYTPKT